MMDKIIQKANTLWGAAVTVLAAAFGEFWFLFAAFLVLNMLDYAELKTDKPYEANMEIVFTDNKSNSLTLITGKILEQLNE